MTRMQWRFIDGAAFVVGLIPPFLQGGLVDSLPWPVRLVLNVLSPGFFVGFAIFQLVGWIGLASISFLFLVSIFGNGLIFGLASYLIRHALEGQRRARITLTIGTSGWVIWGVVWTATAVSRLEPPPARVDLASPLAGRWNGVLHGDRGEVPITLVCHPRVDSTLGGYIYVNDADMGPFEEAVYARDSLYFEIVGFKYAAHFDTTGMALVVSVAGTSNAAELRRVSADTTRPATAR